MAQKNINVTIQLYQHHAFELYKFAKPLTNSRIEIINLKLHPINVNIKLFNKIISTRNV